MIMGRNFISFHQNPIYQNILAHIGIQFRGVVHHDNYFAQMFPIVFTQKLFSNHLLKQIICDNIKKHIILFLDRFNYGCFS